MRRADWYAMRDAGGMWPQMFGPYNEERARAEASRMPGGFAVGFAGAAERGDFLRRWEDRDERARGLAVAQ